jgi:alpha-tubulin suppressor-like RCC1 family protein
MYSLGRYFTVTHSSSTEFLQGEVFTWGKGKNGQMGNGEEVEVNAHSIKVLLPVPAVAVGAGKYVVFGYCGLYHSACECNIEAI